MIVGMEKLCAIARIILGRPVIYKVASPKEIEVKADEYVVTADVTRKASKNRDMWGLLGL